MVHVFATPLRKYMFLNVCHREFSKDTTTFELELCGRSTGTCTATLCVIEL